MFWLIPPGRSRVWLIPTALNLLDRGRECLA